MKNLAKFGHLLMQVAISNLSEKSFVMLLRILILPENCF